MAYKVYKYRIYPDAEQRQKMMQFFGCVRVVYNMCLDNYCQKYEEWKKNGTDIGKTPLVTEFKKEKFFLKDCDNAALAYARTNFDKALSDFFKSKKGKRKGKKVGFPKHKKRGKSKFAYKTCDAHGGIRFDEDYTRIKLPKIGWVKCVYHRKCKGIIKAVTVTMTKSGKFYISVMSEVDAIKPLLNRKKKTENLSVVGLDMSLPKFCVSSCEDDDAIIKYRHEYRREEMRLRRLNRRLSRKENKSKNREKAKKRLSALHEKIANRRKDFIIKSALYFARKYDVVVIEDLNMQNMARSLRLGKSVMDLGWGMFKTWLGIECEKYDTYLMKADKWFASSKTCHKCGAKNTLLELSDREWVCPNCGCVIDRDRNAAINLRDYFLKQYNTAGTAEINACGDNASTLRETLVQVLSSKQEAPHFREG